MTNNNFFEFCVSVARELGMDDIFSLAENNEIILQDVKIGLYYLAETDEVISCFADVGYLDDEIRPEIFETILSINLEMNGVNGESLGFDRDTGHLILRSEMPLHCDVIEVAEYLSEYADFAKDLRALIYSIKNRSKESSDFLIDTLA
jgi:hypothetical protein